MDEESVATKNHLSLPSLLSFPLLPTIASSLPFPPRPFLSITHCLAASPPPRLSPLFIIPSSLHGGNKKLSKGYKVRSSTVTIRVSSLITSNFRPTPLFPSLFVPHPTGNPFVQSCLPLKTSMMMRQGHAPLPTLDLFLTLQSPRNIRPFSTATHFFILLLLIIFRFYIASDTSVRIRIVHTLSINLLTSIDLRNVNKIIYLFPKLVVKMYPSTYRVNSLRS